MEKKGRRGRWGRKEGKGGNWGREERGQESRAGRRVDRRGRSRKAGGREAG